MGTNVEGVHLHKNGDEYDEEQEDFIEEDRGIMTDAFEIVDSNVMMYSI